MSTLSRFLHGSVARAILISLLAVSIVPVGIVAWFFIEQSSAALILEAKQNLMVITNGRATEIDLRLKEIQDKTEIASHYAADLLEQSVDETTVAKSLSRYQPDQRNIIGLDKFYSDSGGGSCSGHRLIECLFERRAHPTNFARDCANRGARPRVLGDQVQQPRNSVDLPFNPIRHDAVVSVGEQ